MKSAKHKFITILDNINSIENYTDQKECNFYEMCRIIDRAVVKITSKTVNNLLGVDTVLWLFCSRDCKAETGDRLTHEYDIHEMYGAFHRTVCEHTRFEKFQVEEFFKNLDKCHDIMAESNGGLKYDTGKLKAGILADFQLALKAIAEVGTFGANKYARNSWQNVSNAIERYTDAMWRHRLSDGVDDESGFPHYYHELWNMLAVVELKEREKHLRRDDKDLVIMFAKYLVSTRGTCENLSCAGSSDTVFEGHECPRRDDKKFPTCNKNEVYEWAKNVIKAAKGE